MKVTVSKLYDSYEEAARGVRELEAAGATDVSLVASNADGWYSDDRLDRDADGTDDRAEGAATGAGVGATAGGIAGLLAGLGLLAIPGLGPVVAAGWLASTAAVAAAGGAAGGLIGALTQAGTSEEEAHVYAEGIRRGGTLVSARIDERDRARIETIMSRAAVDVSARGEAYRNEGWSRFDDQAPPLTREQVLRERERYPTM